MVSKDLDTLLKMAFIEGFNAHKAIANSCWNTNTSWENVTKAVDALKKEYKTTVDDILKPSKEKILELYDEVVQHYKEQNLPIINFPIKYKPNKTYRFLYVKVHHAIGEIDYIKISAPTEQEAIKLFNEVYPEGTYSYVEEYISEKD